MKFIIILLQLVRLPNIFTAISNIWAGSIIAAEAKPIWWQVFVGSLASGALYAGGVTLNDYCDRKSDFLEHPNRPIPSGLISPSLALVLAIIWLALGIGTGFIISIKIGLICTIITLCIILYNVLKNLFFSAVVFLALCRGLNWLLGLALGTKSIEPFLIFPLGMFGYILLLSAISRFEEKISALKQLVKYGLIAIPIIDGAIVLTFGYSWLGLVIMALAVPTIILGRIFEMS